MSNRNSLNRGFGMHCSALAAGAVLLGCFQSAHAAVNLLTDGSFDDTQGAIPSHNLRPGGQGNWVWSGLAGVDTNNPYGSLPDGTPAAPNCVAYNSNPVTGSSQMGYIQGGGSGAGLSVAAQNVALTVGTIYTVSFEAKGITGGNGSTTFSVDPIFVSIFNNGALANPLFGGVTISPSAAGPDTNGFTNYTANFTAINTTEQLDIYDAGGQPSSTVTWVDAVSVSAAAVPEPTSIGLIIAAALPLLARRNRLMQQG